MFVREINSETFGDEGLEDVTSERACHQGSSIRLTGLIINLGKGQTEQEKVLSQGMAFSSGSVGYAQHGSSLEERESL